MMQMSKESDTTTSPGGFILQMNVQIIVRVIPFRCGGGGGGGGCVWAVRRRR